MSSSPEESSTSISRVRSIPELMELIRHAFLDSDFTAIESSIRALHRKPDAPSSWKSREELLVARIGELSEELRERDILCQRYVELRASHADLQTSSRSRIEDLEAELERKREAHEELSKEKDEIREAHEVVKATCAELEKAKMAVEEELRELRSKCFEMEARKAGDDCGDHMTMCSPNKQVVDEGGCWAQRVDKFGEDAIEISDDSKEMLEEELKEEVLEEEELEEEVVEIQTKGSRGMRKEWIRFFNKSRGKR